LIDADTFLKAMGKALTSVLVAPGRRRQSLVESSFDAWIKYYRQDENSLNAIVSYYQKGSLVALALDATIRAKSRNRRSLDDVMRALWVEFGRDFYAGVRRGLGEREIMAVVRRATGLDLGRQIRAWTQGLGALPLAKVLAPFGIAIASHGQGGTTSLGIATTDHDTNCRIVSVNADGAARRAGISAGDTLVAIDNLRVSGTNLDTLLSRYGIGQLVEVLAFRQQALIRLQLRIPQSEPSRWELKTQAGPNRLRNGWLRRAQSARRLANRP